MAKKHAFKAISWAVKITAGYRYNNIPSTTVCNQKFLTFAYVDDVNLILRRLVSLFNALQKIKVFENVSGFRIR